MSTEEEKSHKTDAPQQGTPFPFLLDIVTKSLALHNNSCVILMSCYFLSILLFEWICFLEMTLAECQSPGQAGGGAPPAVPKPRLMKRLRQLFTLAQTLSAGGPPPSNLASM